MSEPLSVGELRALQSEREFQQQVLDLLKLRGWSLVYHTYDSRRSHKGFPDIVTVRKNRLVFIELKSAKGKPTEEQWQWLNALAETQAEVYLWRPSDWDEIMEVLE